jgi:hypothetical protein
MFRSVEMASEACIGAWSQSLAIHKFLCGSWNHALPLNWFFRSDSDITEAPRICLHVRSKKTAMNDQGGHVEGRAWTMKTGERTEKRVSNAEQLGSLLRQGNQANMQIEWTNVSLAGPISCKYTFSASRTYLAIQMGCAIADL